MSNSHPLRLTFKIIGSLLLLAIVLGIIALYLLRGSLAELNGHIDAHGLTEPTTISRDAQGIVTLNGQSRRDIGYALGFAHAQDRFFQMDLLRRNAAGELSELFGERAQNYDQAIRVHQFRQRAETAVKALPAEHQALLLAYAKGVNQGIDQLRSRPFEYHLLQTMPEPWRPADTFLVVLSMYIDLQDAWGEGERSLTAMHDLLPLDWFEFLRPVGGEWDATLDQSNTEFSAQLPQRPLSSFQQATSASASIYRDTLKPGSNNWAVAGALTEHGSAMVANDMHLGLRVPNIWYRAAWRLPELNRQVTGATLPGAPLMIVGSNQHIAWGFTNSFADHYDIIRLQTNAEVSEYLTEDGWQPFDVENEFIKVKGGEMVIQPIKKTQWGPVIGEDHYGHALAMRWTAHDVAGLNLNLLLLETANNIDEAFDIAHQTGIPTQNFMVGDSQGNIGWTLMGMLPKRKGFDSLLSQQLNNDWSQGDKSWQGPLASRHYPQIKNPANHRLWSANARMVGDDDLLTMGDGMGAMGPRQQQIRERLLEAQSFNEAQFLAIQLDNEAVFLGRWQTLLQQTLSHSVLTKHPELSAFKQQVDDWKTHADVNSVGYFIVKSFRERVIDQTAGHVLRFIESQTDAFWPHRIDNRLEYPVWALIDQQPPAHIPAPYQSWDEFLITMAQQLNDELTRGKNELSQHRWGEHNRLKIEHPLSNAVPWLAGFLNMPSVPMPGDTYMPFVQSPNMGASQRMAVAAGHEQDGYFHMATGQSSHPLSAFFGKGHDDWVKGLPSPFLPGETKYQLTLMPAN